LELLEERLPPGDAWVGVLWGLAGADLGLANPGSDPDMAQSARIRLTDGADDPVDPLATPIRTKSQYRTAAAPDRPAPAEDSGVSDLSSAPAAAGSAGAVPSGVSAAAPIAISGLAVGAPAGHTGVESGAAASPRSRTTAAALATPPARSGGTAAAPSAQRAYGQLPLSFERNLGQTAAQVDYLAHTGNGTVFLTPTAAVFAIQKPPAVAPTGDPNNDAGIAGAKPTAPSSSGGAAVYMQIFGANPAGRPVGQEELAGKVNYFIGNDPAKWHTNIPTFGRVEYPNIYPGISLAYYGGPSGLEYDFVLSPGADAHEITLDFRGADGVALDAQGDLVVHTAAGDQVQHAPVVYQDVNGGRQPVSGRFALDSGLVRFDVGAYDHSRALVIDPLVLGYSTYLGGSGTDFGYGIAVDGKGAAYVVGQTLSTNFPTTPGAFDTSYNGGQLGDAGDAFVAKLATDGHALVYSTYLGGSQGDAGYGISVDASGNAYVTGIASFDFPATVHFGSHHYGSVFITKLTPTGSGLAYSALVSGAEGYAVAVDAAGEALITGRAGVDLPVTPGAFQTLFGGPANQLNDAFALKLNASGTDLVYATYLGGNKNDYGYGIAADSAGHAFVAGYTWSFDFPTTPGSFQPVSGGATDVFLVKLSADGSALDYGSYLGGSGFDYGYAVAVDAAGAAYLTGYTPGGFPITVQFGSYDSGAFITKVNPTGSALVYSAVLSAGYGHGMAVNAAGSAYITGFSWYNGLPTTSDAFDTTFNGGNYCGDAFMSEVSADATQLVYSTYLGGSNDDCGNGIAVDAGGNVYVTGDTKSADFPTSQDAFKRRNRNGVEDGFVTKFALA
jgi:hypothetical protein